MCWSELPPRASSLLITERDARGSARHVVAPAQMCPGWGRAWRFPYAEAEGRPRAGHTAGGHGPTGTKESDVAKGTKNVGYDSAIGRRLHTAVRRGSRQSPCVGGRRARRYLCGHPVAG